MHKCTVSVIRYNEPDYILINLLVALSQQENIVMEVVVIDQLLLDSSKKKIQTLCYKLSSENIAFRYVNVSFSSLSEARNFVLMQAKEKILFIDCDAEPSKNWAYAMTVELNKSKSAIVGSCIKVVWMAPVFSFFNHPLIKIPFFSDFNLHTNRKNVVKVIGASFGVDKLKLKGLCFDKNLGYAPGRKTGGEETDLCMRILAAGLNVVYIGNTYVYHNISGERTTFLALCKSIYNTGAHRQRRGGVPSPNLRLIESLRPFNLIVYLLLSLYFFGYGFSFLGRKFQPLKGIVQSR